MTPIPGPFIVLVLPLLAAVLAFLVRRWALLAAILSAAVTGALAILCLRLPLDRAAFVLGQEVAFGRPVAILSRNLVLEPAGQAWLAGSSWCHREAPSFRSAWWSSACMRSLPCCTP